MSKLINPIKIRHQVAYMPMPKGDLTIVDPKYIRLNRSGKLNRREDLDRKALHEHNAQLAFWTPPKWDKVKVAARHEKVRYGGQEFEPLIVTVYCRDQDSAKEIAEAIRVAFYGDRETLFRQDKHGIEFCQWVPGLNPIAPTGHLSG